MPRLASNLALVALALLGSVALASARPMNGRALLELQPYAGVCSGATGCPTSGNYFHCMASPEGKAVGGCRPISEGAFPSADCATQCSTKTITLPKCDMPTECPADGKDWHYCMAGDAVGGCQTSMWLPGHACDAQCITNNESEPTASPVPSPVPSPMPTPSPVPTPPVEGICTAPNDCPKTGGSFYYCPASNGCRPTGQGAFPAADCAEQCVTVDYTVGMCPEGIENECADGPHYFCMEGDAKGGCSSLDNGSFAPAACPKQCRLAY